MRILFLPNWRVHPIDSDTEQYQSPDKTIKNQPYWFFRYFSDAPMVDIIDFSQPNRLTWLEKRINLYIWQGIKAFRVARRYDVVISHGAQSGLVYALLNVLRWRKKPAHVIFDIGAMNGGRNHPMELAVIRLALLSKPWVICHSKVIIEDYKSRFPALADRSVFIPFGVDVAEFSVLKNEVDTKTPYVLSFGAAKRDYATLIKAWNKLEQSRYTPKVKLKIVGVSKMVETNPMIEFVEKVSIATLKKMISQALFVVIPLPYFRYSYGQMSFLQSMCMGKPVIVTKTPSSEDYLIECEGAFFVPPNDAVSLADAIDRLLSQPDLIRTEGLKAQRYVCQFNSEPQMAREIEAFLNRAVNGG